MNTATTPRQQVPSWPAIEEALRLLQVQCLSDPEFKWLSISFEDMADAVSKAIFCAADDAPKWADLPGFGNVRGELDALTVRRVGV